MSNDQEMLDATRRGELAGLRRRVVLTLRYQGPRAVLWRALTFPLRFTPLRPYVRFGRDPAQERYLATRWYRSHGQPVTVVIPSFRDAGHVRRLVRSIRRTTDGTRVRIVVADDASGPEHLAALRRIRGIEVVAGNDNAGFAANVNRGIAAADPHGDVVVLNSDMRARRGWLAALQRAALTHRDAGIVGAKLLYPDGRIQSAGTIRNPDHPDWFDHMYRGKPNTWGPANIAQPVLAVTGACMYIRRVALERLGGFDERYPMGFEDVDLCLRVWEAGLRVLYEPVAVLEHEESVTRGQAAGPRERTSQSRFWKRWREFFDGRSVRSDTGAVRVIYVTQDTGVGGGHRVVFEHLHGLRERGHEVELWCLAEPPDWFDLDVPVRTFADYGALTRELASVDAIKVATWWRTATPVWEASVVRGLPVYLVQDIETSYYPDSERTRHAVLASYRSEFRYLTTSTWNRERLAELQLQAELVSPGIDLVTFAPRNVRRRADMVLAVGRSNPLKNFRLTRAAWEALAAPRPELCLYGIEPELTEGVPGIRYVVAPSDGDVDRLLAEATVFVQTSTHEGFCLPVLEAMAAGCPVVCTDADGNRDFCHHERNCVMVGFEAGGVAAAIARVLEDPELRERLSRAGMQTAMQYGWPERIEALGRYLTSVAEAAAYAASNPRAAPSPRLR